MGIQIGFYLPLAFFFVALYLVASSIHMDLQTVFLFFSFVVVVVVVVVVVSIVVVVSVVVSIVIVVSVVVVVVGDGADVFSSSWCV